MRGEWIEMAAAHQWPGDSMSLPMRGEWIEITARPAGKAKRRVSPRVGRVD